jgi:hypothetical protein
MSKGMSTEIGYRVEARDALFTHLNPAVLSDGVLTSEWREIRFEEGPNPAGIPREPFGRKHDYGLLTYEGATALAWTLIAQNRLRSIEARLVQYQLETTYEYYRDGLVDMEPLTSAIIRNIKIKPEAQPETQEPTNE